MDLRLPGEARYRDRDRDRDKLLRHLVKASTHALLRVTSTLTCLLRLVDRMLGQHLRLCKVCNRDLLRPLGRMRRHLDIRLDTIRRPDHPVATTAGRR